MTALDDSVQNRHLDVDNKLIEARADVNKKDTKGMTALHHAAQNGHLDVVNKLIAAGADPNAVDNDGKTALHHAAKKIYTEVVNKLIAAGADVSAKANDGCTPAELVTDNNPEASNLRDILNDELHGGGLLTVRWGQSTAQNNPTGGSVDKPRNKR